MIELLIGPIYKILDKVIPDLDKRAEMANKIATMVEDQAHENALAQLKVNEKEAMHRSLFVAGWRPAMGWVSVSGFAMNYLIFPFTDIPPLELGPMIPILMGMLGLGGLRSMEKKMGLTK
jgi:Holin of 3TMs, for gene-transfer release